MKNNKLDYQIAKKVMGWAENIIEKSEKFPRFFVESGGCVWVEYSACEDISSFSPSSNMYDAWMVVLKIRELDEHWCPNIYWDDADGLGNPFWVAAFQYFGGEEDFVEHLAISETSAPLAICLAALKVLGEENENEKR